MLVRCGSTLDVDKLVKDFRVRELQLAEIARTLLMDEPTSALSQTAPDILKEALRDLVFQGVAVIYISHRMNFLSEGRITGQLSAEDMIATTASITDVVPVFGALTSPLSYMGNITFLSIGNLTDVLRHVSVVVFSLWRRFVRVNRTRVSGLR